MPITLVVPKISEKKKDEWSINIIFSENNTHFITATANVTHVKTKKPSHDFKIEYDQSSGIASVESDEYRWTSCLDPDLLFPKQIIKKCLKIPLMVSVMYRVDCRIVEDIDTMNNYFGLKIFNK
jgi:hypothetical protein